ncbi:hypothetical protein GDO86_017407 [Hymenochirus boettgeri]|uniref:RRM domain-containing protein n=1 Tax=Hymenochirus boettgeri TaxID=247094 RepID=A0A8T2IQC6_9PIPI|nr:hypothetical protein GDO86_017407 [Hymenochirus boettgeri]
MEQDLENKNVLYVSGFNESLTVESLQQRFSQYEDIKEIFLPSQSENGEHATYCFLKCHHSKGANMAAERILADGELRCRKAITACHFHQWLQSVELQIPEQAFPKEDGLSDIIENLDNKILKVYEHLPANTLCLVLFPGKKSAYVSFQGLGFIGIKEQSV